MIPVRVIVLSLALICPFSFVAGKDALQSLQLENGDNQEAGAGSPVLQMLTQMMNPNSKSASLKELQKKFESDRTHIQKIPRRNQEKQELEEKRKELEEKERELEGNFVVSPDFDKYAYKSPKRSSITYTIGTTCQLATCYEDGKPFLNIHNYCYKGINDLQAACEERYLSARYRRAGKEILEQAPQLPNSTNGGKCYNIGATWKDDCNTCVCLAVGLPACTRMSCPPKDMHPIAHSPNGSTPINQHNSSRPESFQQNSFMNEKVGKHIKA